MKYAIVVRPAPDEDGGYYAFVPDLNGCIGDGDTYQAAVADVINAIDEWITEAKRLGREVPEPGSAAKEHRERDAVRREAVKKVLELAKDLEMKIENQSERIEVIERDLQFLLECEENNQAWSKLADRLGIPATKETVTKRSNRKLKAH